MVKIEWFNLESDAVKEYLQKAIKHIERTYNSHKTFLTPEIKEAIFCDDNGYFSKENVEKFLKYTKHDLMEIGFFKDYIKTQSEKQIDKKTPVSEREEAIKKIFDYSILNRPRSRNTLRHKLLSSLNVDCCPYCNRQYITTYKNVSRIRYSTADLDHFYPRTRYPLFALSLFNFVPSCQICNSRMKLDKAEECLYPYEESFGNDAFFTVSTDKGDKKTHEYYQELLYSFMGREAYNLPIKIKNNAKDAELSKRINKSIEIFKLNEVYQAHQEYVRELLIKQRIYDEGAYLNMLKEQFGKLGLQFAESELEVFLYGFRWDDEDHHTRPLSKLTYDLIKRNPKSHI